MTYALGTLTESLHTCSEQLIQIDIDCLPGPHVEHGPRRLKFELLERAESKQFTAIGNSVISGLNSIAKRITNCQYPLEAVSNNCRSQLPMRVSRVTKCIDNLLHFGGPTSCSERLLLALNTTAHISLCVIRHTPSCARTCTVSLHFFIFFSRSLPY